MLIKWLLNFSVLLSIFMLSSETGLSSDIWTMHLDNGMQILMLEDHTSSLSASVICIRAGSRTETIPNNGISHLLEHLLFDGTTTRTRDKLENAVTSQGGYFNAFTRKDYVCFEMVMPSDKFIAGLNLQADQVLNSTIPAAELEKERKVVCEEIARDFNNPFSTVENFIMGLISGDSGYGLPVLGNYQTVSSVTREEIDRFYKTRYVPNRMTMVIVGDVNPPEIIENLKRIYEPVPAGPEQPPIRFKTDLPGYADPQITRRPIPTEAMMMVFPAPDLTDPDALAFEIAVDLWANGSMSPLSTALTSGQEPLASHAGAWVSDFRGFSYLNVFISPISSGGTGMMPGKMSADTGSPLADAKALAKAKSIQEKVLNSLNTFLSSEIDEKDFTRTITQLKSNHVFAKEKFVHFARDIAHYDALNALPSFLNRETILDNMKVQDIIPAAQKSLKTAVPLTVFVIPDQNGKDTKSIDLDTEPSMIKLTNGLKVIAKHDPGAEIMAFHLLIPNTGEYPEGVPRFVSEMLDKGTARFDAEQLEDTLSDHGIKTQLVDIPWLPYDDYYNTSEYSYMRFECLASEAEPALEILVEMAFNPVFPESELEKVRRKLTGVSLQQSKKSSKISKQLLESMMFPDAVYSKRMIPLTSELPAIERADLVEFHKTAYHPGNCILAMVGKMPKKDMIRMAKAIFDSLPSVETSDEPPSPGSPEPSRKTASVKTEQAHIRAGIALTTSPEDIPVLDITAKLLSERVQAEIREKMGMAYALGASASHRKGLTVLSIGVGTRAVNLPEVEAKLRQIIDDFRKATIPASQVSAAANALYGRELRYRQRRINQAYYLCWQEYLGHGFKSDAETIEKLHWIKEDQVNTLIKTIIPESSKWFWAVVDAE